MVSRPIENTELPWLVYNTRKTQVVALRDGVNITDC